MINKLKDPELQLLLFLILLFIVGMILVIKYYFLNL